MQNLHITLLLQFSFLKNVGDMTCYDRLIFIEKFSHLSLTQPYRFILNGNVNRHISVGCLIYHQL
ncbi:unknown [Prevotella sp. CAG:485]|nr:unknown [Prevotella sp. CAG:485]